MVLFYALISDIQLVSLSARTISVQVTSLGMFVAGPVEWLLVSDGSFVRSPMEVSLWQRVFGPAPGK